ncbi:TonB family protein [Oleiharenicola lentus]|uniref:TonB family protein n=1 Tax=Oleiharenicola lentus TaxID=2508720 RepID=UPI003F677317
MHRAAFLLLVLAFTGCASVSQRGLENPHIETSSFSYDAGTYRGEAEVYVVAVVNAQGQLGDWLIAGSSDPAAEPVAEQVLRMLYFHPARWQGGRQAGPLGILLYLAGGQGVAASTVADALSVSMTPRPTDRMVRIFQLEQLDATPVLLKHVPPARVEGRGAVTLQFWVDESGAVRLPSVVAGFDDGLSRAALDAVSQWKFSAPLKAGRPVTALFRQQFEFR